MNETMKDVIIVVVTFGVTLIGGLIVTFFTNHKDYTLWYNKITIRQIFWITIGLLIIGEIGYFIGKYNN
jgi:hypothetical protein